MRYKIVNKSQFLSFFTNQKHYSHAFSFCIGSQYRFFSKKAKVTANRCKWASFTSLWSEFVLTDFGSEVFRCRNDTKYKTLWLNCRSWHLRMLYQKCYLCQVLHWFQYHAFKTSARPPYHPSIHPSFLPKTWPMHAHYKWKVPLKATLRIVLLFLRTRNPWWSSITKSLFFLSSSSEKFCVVDVGQQEPLTSISPGARGRISSVCWGWRYHSLPSPASPQAPWRRIRLTERRVRKRHESDFSDNTKIMIYSC